MFKCEHNMKIHVHVFCFIYLGRQEKVEHYRDGRLMNTLTDEKDFNYKWTIEKV